MELEVEDRESERWQRGEKQHARPAVVVDGPLGGDLAALGVDHAQRRRCGPSARQPHLDEVLPRRRQRIEDDDRFPLAAGVQMGGHGSD